MLRAYNEQVKKQLCLYGRITKTGLIERTVSSPASRFMKELCSALENFPLLMMK